MTISSDKQILGFKIAVDDIFGVEVVESDEYLKEVELGLFLGHPFDLFELVEELSPWAI